MLIVLLGFKSVIKYPLILSKFYTFYQKSHTCTIHVADSGPWLKSADCISTMGLLPDTQNRWLRMRRECRKRFPRPPTSRETGSYRSRHASRHVRHARAVMHAGIANPRCRGKRSRHSRRMRNPQFYVSGKRPMVESYSTQCNTRWPRHSHSHPPQL